jgi:hypothetical protein
MQSYTISGHTFRSRISLPELVAGDKPRVDFTVELCASPENAFSPARWTHHWYSPDGTVWLAFAHIETGHLLRFPKLADFVISTDARSVCCYPGSDVPYATVRHLLLNQVIPLVLSQLGRLVLHAAACDTPHGAIAYLGTTGTGKSTLAASFGLQGFPILADDCLLVEEQNGAVLGRPSYPGIRLWPESVSALFTRKPALQPLAHYTEKRRLLFEQPQPKGPVPLAAIYRLSQPDETGESTEIAIEPMRTSEALLEIIKHTFQLDTTDQQILRRGFRQYEWLAKSVPFFRLAFPRQHAYLPAVNRAILSHLQTLQPAVLIEHSVG